MKRIAAIVAFIAIATICFFGVKQVAVHKRSTEKPLVKGIVVDLDTKEVLTKAVITCISDTDSKKFKIKLDKNGEFRLYKLLYGDYDWIVEVPGYRTARYSSYPIGPSGVEFYFEISKDIVIDKSYRN